MSTADLTQYQLFRAPSSDGTGTRDWAIGVSRAGNIRLRMGTTGATATLQEMPCPHGFNVNQELERQIQAQRERGYEFVGWAEIKNGHLVLKPTGQTSSEGVLWEIQGIQAPTFLAHLEKTLEELKSGPLPHALTYNGQSCLVSAEERVWEFGYSAQGGMSHTEPSGGGKIVQEHGILPCLILIRFQRSFPTQVKIECKGNLLEPRIARTDPMFALLLPSGLSEEQWDEYQEIAARCRLCASPKERRAYEAESLKAIWLS